jgi:cellulose synthase/poly-beta-1,6-N-acetylglucosamine synthase-like glycosyltransferase
MDLPIQLIAVLLLVVAIALLVPIAMLLLECSAALLPEAQQHRDFLRPRPNIAVLVPAHNEALGIELTLRNLLDNLRADDKLIVIADNCTDSTAAIAHSLGATVIERYNLTQRGKGYALDYGLKFLADEPPDVVVFVDADCTVSPGAIEQIAQLALAQSRPVQATYLLNRPGRLAPKDAVSILAFTVKNLVRPLGLTRLGLPCLLTGTGMAFPWSMIHTVSLASGNIVEDMQLSLDLAIAGYPATLCAEAKVTGALPQQEQAAKSQRTRWEHGHLQTLLTQVPRLLQAAVRQGRLDLLAIALDLSIPPLSLLVMLWVAALVVCGAFAALGGSFLPVFLLMLGGVLLFVAVFTAWASFSRSELPLTTLLSVPLYILWKIPLYLAFLISPQTKWVRTERDAINPKS